MQFLIEEAIEWRLKYEDAQQATAEPPEQAAPARGPVIPPPMGQAERAEFWRRHDAGLT